MLLRIRIAAVCAAAGALAWLAGCAAGDTHYLLSSDGPAPGGAAGRAAVGLGPVSIPDYINRPELVFQSGPNRFEVPANQRWMGSLEENITEVLASNLSRRLAGDAVRINPGPGASPEVSVAVEIRRFHAVSGGDAVLEAAWHLSGSATGTHRAALREPLEQEGYDGVVAAESRLLARLADAIAASLRDE